MPRPILLALLLSAPLVVFAGLVAADHHFGGPVRGYDYVIHLELPRAEAQVGLPKVEGPQDAGRPLVVIDAGHGGHDPGAGTGTLKEKELTLSLAKALRDELLRAGGIRVAMTRDDDRYLMLEERSGIARRLKADLFLSIHADSAGDTAATGASVYTLSERGSSQTAAAMAERENRADSINGVQLRGTSDAVSAILVDLSQRETQAKSDALASLLLREVRGRIPLREDGVQSAAFVVLKSPDMPSVLFESGFISNEADAERLASPEGRALFAKLAAQAIRAYFARQSAL